MFIVYIYDENGMMLPLKQFHNYGSAEQYAENIRGACIGKAR